MFIDFWVISFTDVEQILGYGPTRGVGLKYLFNQVVPLGGRVKSVRRRQKWLYAKYSVH